MLTLSQRLKLEGKEEGLAAAIKAINLLSQGAELDVISRATGLSPDVINALALRETAGN